MSPKTLTRFFHIVEIPCDRKRSLVLGVWENNNHICKRSCCLYLHRMGRTPSLEKSPFFCGKLLIIKTLDVCIFLHYTHSYGFVRALENAIIPSSLSQY